VPLGNRPSYPGKRPPYKPDVRCIDNKRPNLMGPASAKSDPTPPPPGVASVSRAELRRATTARRPAAGPYTRQRTAP
jgi:hypothetical protein